MSFTTICVLDLIILCLKMDLSMWRIYRDLGLQQDYARTRGASSMGLGDVKYRTSGRKLWLTRAQNTGSGDAKRIVSVSVNVEDNWESVTFFKKNVWCSFYFSDRDRTVAWVPKFQQEFRPAPFYLSLSCTYSIPVSWRNWKRKLVNVHGSFSRNKKPSKDVK